jgi:hypothetical protein
MSKRRTPDTLPAESQQDAHQGPLAPWFGALVQAWQACAGTPTVMEEQTPQVVLRFADGACAVLVALRPDNLRAYGLFDDAQGNVQVGVYDLAGFGYPRAEAAAYVGDEKVLALYWKARDGLPYLDAKAATKPGDNAPAA